MIRRGAADRLAGRKSSHVGIVAGAVVGFLLLGLVVAGVIVTRESDARQADFQRTLREPQESIDASKRKHDEFMAKVADWQDRLKAGSDAIAKRNSRTPRAKWDATVKSLWALGWTPCKICGGAGNSDGTLADEDDGSCWQCSGRGLNPPPGPLR